MSRRQPTELRPRAALIDQLEPRRLLSKTIYVDASAPAGGTHDGFSWAQAYTDLSLALSTATAGDQVLVANGTYKPTSTPDRSADFPLISGASLLGGYAGYGAPDPNARDIAANLTTLSGFVGAEVTQSSFHVLYASNVSASTLLDGFTVTGGYADNGGSIGGGLYITLGAGPTVRNCTFTNNFASSYGGAIGIDRSSPSISNCTFTGNSAGTSLGGAAVAISGSVSSPVISDCTFLRNRSFSAGGAVYSSGAVTATLANCLFCGNSAYTGGGAFAGTGTIRNCVFSGNFVYGGPSAPGGAVVANPYSTITNCTFAGNTGKNGGNAISTSAGAPSAPKVVNCILWDSTGGTEIYTAPPFGTVSVTYSVVHNGYTGTGNSSADPLFARSPSAGPDLTWGTPDDDYGDLRLLPNSPGLDAGSNAALPAGPTTDLAGNPRTFDFPGAGTAGVATVDMGAYELTQNLGSLHVAAGQTVALPAGGYAFSATQVTVDPGGTLDLADDSLLIDYTGPSPLAAVRSVLFSGRNGGAWNGTGIVSSAAHTTANRGIGYAEAAVLGLTTFGGQAVDATALLLKYTTAGDANLDGRITGDDYALADRGKAKGLGTWVFGDFDYDGAVTGADYAILNASAAPPPAPAPVVPVVVDTPADLVTAAVDPAPVLPQVVAPAKTAAAPHAKSAPAKAKAKPAKHAPVTKPKAKPTPAPKPKPKPAPRAATSSHLVSHR